MKKIIVVVILTIFLVTISVSAAELEISPETIEIDLTGGDSVLLNLTINWSGSYSASCELTTYIEPDGEGINVTYSKHNFTMLPSSENKIIMYINTSMLLIPGTYVITTNVSVEMEELLPPSPPDGDDSNPPWGKFAGQEPINLTELEDEPEDEKEEFNNTIYYKINVENTPVCPFLVALGVILLSIIVLYLLSKRIKQAEKPGKGKK